MSRPQRQGRLHRVPAEPTQEDAAQAEGHAAPEDASTQGAEAEGLMSTYAYNQLIEGINAARNNVAKEASDLGIQSDAEAQRAIDKVAIAMANIIANDDPYFDRDHFLQATIFLPPTVEQHPNETGWTGR